MAQVNIWVPRDLRERMSRCMKLDPAINWSTVCADAINRKCLITEAQHSVRGDSDGTDQAETD